MDRSTIAAIATPIGSAGIGIIRISGQDALAIARSIFRKSKTGPAMNRGSTPLAAPVLKSHTLHHGYVVDPENGRLLDEVLLSFMQAPQSYTREDVIEINTHSGTVILKNILALVVKMGASLAEPGEFTKRAYLNGRIDLTQAEAVMDIITARTDKSLEMATAHLVGEFKIFVETTREILIQTIAEMEASIDFPDDIEATSTPETVIENLNQKILFPLRELVDRYHQAHILRDGLVLAVVGKPNVGKSSLMNRLLQKERVIVSSVPGTTRDFIEETANIHGIPIVITDTAGLHETEDPIEVLGIQKTREYIDSADLILFVVDSSRPLTDADFLIFDTIKEKNVLLVLNKSDLIKNGYRIQKPKTWHKLQEVAISARYNYGLNDLKDLIARVSMEDLNLDVGNHIVPNLRQTLELDKCQKAVAAAVDGLNAKTPAELVVIDLYAAIAALDAIVGLTVQADILDHIFSRFCIGK